MTRGFLWLGLVVLSGLAAPGAGRADSGTYQITGGFTTFTGTVLGNDTPTYIRAFGLSPVSVDCGEINCSNPLLFFGQVCPDAGCSATQGAATNYSLLTFGSDPTNYLTFESFSCPDIAICANTPNELDFVPSTSSILGFNPISETTEMLLGSLTFTNGTWPADADFGITITATDVKTPHDAYTFNGFLHMTLNSSASGLTNPVAIAQGDADSITLHNSSNQPLVDPFTGENIGSVFAYEITNPLGLSNTASFNLYGTIGSLDPTRFGDLTGDGFLSGAAPSEVPEPSGIILCGSALIIVTVRARRGTRAARRERL